MKLKNIKQSTQNVAEAISSILDLDVTIIDSNMNRVAATGIYKEEVGNKLPSNCYFEIVGKEKKPKFVLKANFSGKCVDCANKGSCKELGSLGYPIVENGELLGIIGILAFDNIQQEKIKNNYNTLLNFLNHLAKLLVADLNYSATIHKLMVQDEFTKTIINEMDNGIVVTDAGGGIKLINNKGLDFLRIGKNEYLDKNIRDFIPNFIPNKNINLFSKYYIPNNEKVDFNIMVKTIPVYLKNKKVNNILKLKETSTMIKDAYDLMEGSKKVSFDDIIGQSKEISHTIQLAKSIVNSDSTVLLRGESGTGKDLFARAIHEASPRSSHPYIAINCASIPDSLLESEFFGYEEGSFTGAKKEGHIGKFELANGGTLFLDEIGDMPLHLQPKILRVLQDKQFMKIGGKDLVSTDFRLIAATNQNLEEMIRLGSFRQDLYYRLKVIPINIPNLKERDGDLNILITYFMRQHCEKLKTPIKTFSQEALSLLSNYSWPGNVRELENTIEYLANVVEGDLINIGDLPQAIKNIEASKPCVLRSNSSLEEMMEAYEKKLLQEFLTEYGQTTEDKKLISEKLNINLSTLYRKLSKYDL